MKKGIIIATLLVSGFVIGQTNLFERIAKAEPDNWLPLYYAAQINIIYSFGERDEEKLSSKLIKAQNLINDATTISKNNAPENPRVVYCKAEWDIGGAKYFGQDTKPFCKELERAIELFANFKPETAFHPNWGKDRAEALLESCK